MKNFALTALLAAGLGATASAQQAPCAYSWNGAPPPLDCVRSAPVYQSAPVYAAPVYVTPRYATPVYPARPYPTPVYPAPQYPVSQYVPAPPPPMNVPAYDTQYTPYDRWYGWDGQRVDIYVDNVLVMQNVYRDDVRNLRFRRAGRHLIRVVPVGYAYNQPIYSTYYNVPQSNFSLTFSLGGSFNIVLR